MRFRHALDVARIELTRLFRSRTYWIPLTTLTGLLFVLIPAMMLWGAVGWRPGAVALQLGDAIRHLPPQIKEGIRGETPGVQLAYGLASYLLAPIAIVVPLTISAAVGANAVVGERERGTGEFLAHSPLSELEIYAGKLAAAFVPGMIANTAGFAAYSLVVNLIVGPHMGGWFFPTPEWWLLVFWVVPPFIVIALAVIIRLSSVSRTASAAQQAATLITVPVILVSYLFTFGLLFGPPLLSVAGGAVGWLVVAARLRPDSRAVRRDRLIESGEAR